MIQIAMIAATMGSIGSHPDGGEDHRRRDHTDRSGGVGHGIEVGTFDGDAGAGPAAQHREHDQVHDQAEDGDDEHRARFDLEVAVDQPERGFDQHVGRDDDQQDRVHE